MYGSKRVQNYRLLKGVFILLTFLLPHAIQAQRGYYTPKSLFIPLHSQKNQLHASLGKGGGYQLNLSYAFANKVVLFQSATLDKGVGKWVSVFGDRYNVHRNDYVLKSGIGYFSKIDKPLISVIEGYMGAGISKINNHWYFVDKDIDKEFTRAKYWTGFVQFNAGKQLENNEFSVGLRFAYSKYLNASFYSDNSDGSPKSRYENLYGFTVDPALNYSYLVKNFKLNAQAGFSFPLTYSSIRRADFYTSTVIMSEEQVPLLALIGQLSLQYNLNFSGKDSISRLEAR